MNSTSIASLVVLLAAAAGCYASYEAGYTAGSSKLSDATSANKSCLGTIASLKLSLSECEADRTVDLAAQAKALSERDAKAKETITAYAAAKAKLKALMQGECVDWAKQPACGSVP